jgi:hypothetical protein
VNRCASCGAPIRWVRLAPHLSPHPVDTEPAPNGTIELSADGSNRARVVKPSEERELYVSHFASCPHAKAWRRESRRKNTSKRRRRTG